MLGFDTDLSCSNPTAKDTVYQIAEEDELRRFGFSLWSIVFTITGGAISFMAAAALAQQDEPEPTPEDIIVFGRTDGKIRGGQWEITLSRSFPFGQTLTSDDRFASGRNRTFTFCLPDTQIEALTRVLVGEGQTQSSGTAKCGRLAVSMESGKVIARQTCVGLRMPVPKSVESMVPSAGTPVDVCGWKRSSATTTEASGKLTVTGKYASERLRLDFRDERQPQCVDPSFQSRPYGRTWTIAGKRLSDCAVTAPQDQKKP